MIHIINIEDFKDFKRDEILASSSTKKLILRTEWNGSYFKQTLVLYKLRLTFGSKEFVESGLYDDDFETAINDYNKLP